MIDDDEKRHIADVIARAVFGGGTDNRSRLFTYLTSHPANEHGDPMLAHGGFEIAWWTVMDWVEAKGWLWTFDFGDRGKRKQWRLSGPLWDFYAHESIGERWARLSCVAQAIEAGVIK